MSWRFQIDFEPRLMVIGILLFAVYLYFMLKPERRGAFFSARWLTFSSVLQIFSFLLILFLLFRPELIFRYESKQLPRLVVLRDISRSMDTTDVEMDGKLLSRKEWIDRFCSTELKGEVASLYDLVFKDFAGVSEKGEEINNNATNIAKALDDVGKEKASEVILLSDGQWNEGGSPIKAATELFLSGVKVHCVGVGSEKYLPDIELRDVRLPSFCMLGESLAIPYTIHNKFSEGKNIIFKWSDGQTREDTEIKIEKNALYRGKVMWKPEKAGKYIINMEIPLLEGETEKGNNNFSGEIEVKEEKIKVLIADSLPRWEFRFLKNATTRDSGVDAEYILLPPGMKPGEGKGYRPDFPTGDELKNYDIIIIGDLSADEIGKDVLAQINTCVYAGGAGLILMPGRRGVFFTLEESPIKDLIPVISDPMYESGISCEYESAVELTNYGSSHHLSMLEDTPAENMNLWRNLPGISWTWAVGETKPGSRVLAVSSVHRNKQGRMPLIVERSYGNGLILFMGCDHVWRWRKAVEDKYHYRFWSQVMRWMAHKRYIGKESGVRIFYDPENPVAGKEVNFFLMLTDKFPLKAEDIRLIISDESGRSEKIEILQDKKEKNYFTATYLPAKDGNYKIAVSGAGYGKIVELDMKVGIEREEKIGEPICIDTIKAIAGAGGGDWADCSGVKNFLEHLIANARSRIEERRISFWNNVYVYFAIFAILFTVWTTRKVSGQL